MPTALFYDVFSQVSLPESRAFCPKNYIISADEGGAARSPLFPPPPPTPMVIRKNLDKRLNEQIMGKLPVDTLRSSPTWTCNAVDLFEPIKIRDEVKKRTTGKTYGVILNCLGSRAVHVDLAADYSTEEFLMVLRRFVSI